MALLTVKGLKVHFETREGIVRAVDGIDFTLGEGESLALAGEVAGGKTTAAHPLLQHPEGTPGAQRIDHDLSNSSRAVRPFTHMEQI